MFRISWKKDGGEDLEAFYPIRPECRPNVPKTRFKSRVGKTLSARRWHAAFSEDGHLDIAKVLRRIQRGGIHPSIKGLVWEFLLGCFDPSSTFDERNQIRQRRREQYGTWKAECQSMVPVIGSGKIIMASIITDNGQPIQNSSINGYLEDQGGHASNVVSDKKVIEWKLLLHQIGLDVARTDRTLVFYESETNQAKLWDILAVYAWVDNDIGYVQGMSDICSPMVILFENEADAFWCFEHAMRRLRENFRCSASSMGVQTQLSALSQVIKTIDPKLHQHLEDLDGGEYLFAFRMLMVLFRREFSFVDALYLWELMWAMEYNPNIFSSYEEPKAATDKGVAPVSDKLLKQCGKFARKNVKTGHTDQNNAFAVYLVASVLETKNKQLLKEAKGLDDVAKILGDTTGNLDAKKACDEALKIHKKYLTKCSARMKGSIFTYPLEGIKHLMSEEGEMLTKPFLDVCKNLLPVLDNFGSAMALVKSDVGGNISRLESKYLSNPSEFNLLYNLVRAEVKAKTAKATSSCTNALLWLTRAMDFLVELFRNLLAHPNWTMSQACNDAYNKTLKKWNNWLASSSFNVAMKLVPDRKKFMDIIDGTGDFNTEIENFCANFCPLLQQNHKFLNGVGMDNMKAS